MCPSADGSNCGEVISVMRVLKVLRFSWRTRLRGNAIAIERLLIARNGPIIQLRILWMYVRTTLRKRGRILIGLRYKGRLSTAIHVHFVGVAVVSHGIECR